MQAKGHCATFAPEPFQSDSKPVVMHRRGWKCTRSEPASKPAERACKGIPCRLKYTTCLYYRSIIRIVVW